MRKHLSMLYSKGENFGGAICGSGAWASDTVGGDILVSR
jgi:hypothetical protein